MRNMTEQKGGLFPADVEASIAVWDQLAEYSLANTDQALQFLLETLCRKLNAKNAYWIAAVRIHQHDSKDPMLGWRPSVTVHLHKPKPLADLIKERIKAINKGQIKESTRSLVSQAGQYRVATLRELVSDQFYESEGYQQTYVAMGIADAMWSVFPVNRDCESYFCVQRKEPFSDAEKRYMAMMLRGIRWFHRQLMLSYGLMVANQPITVSERRVVKALLSGKSEHEIAEKLGWTKSTTHGYVTQVFRKFNVRGRAEFAALWLGNR